MIELEQPEAPFPPKKMTSSPNTKSSRLAHGRTSAGSLRMMLVAYSDSEGSDTEDAPRPSVKPTQKPAASANFAVDKANPKKIRVNLTDALSSSLHREDGEPAAKRPRVGGGTFSGFNAMLPPPKRDNDKPLNGGRNGSKPPPRKVFSLKTGAEPAFSRESDAELKQLLAGHEEAQEQEEEQEQDADAQPSTIPSTLPKPSFISEPTKQTQTHGKPFMFKPLSVARNAKKKRPASQQTPPNTVPPTQTVTSASTQEAHHAENPLPPAATNLGKINLFSSGPTVLPPDPEDTVHNDDEDNRILEAPNDQAEPVNPSTAQPMQAPESLTSIADSLNLTPAERRQLLGRNSQASQGKIINFNTDAEYAANQAHIAAGEQVQHVPVRAIAPGKHSLKSLVASAQGQKEALEESFAAGRRNKKEAGMKYGW